ncbi:MAG: ORF6N domain-containing protein [Akkermansia sp.]|nr:ORF6N domain-containing protein [Akkermansia sp.]
MSLSLPQLAHRGVPVVLTSTLADAYEVKPINIQKNFTQNRDRFIEGKHYYTISGSDLKEFKNRLTESKSVQIGKNARTLTLWTERGAARHAKMLNSDKAWDMFELLEETFFRVAEQRNSEEMSIEERRPLANLVGQWQAKSQMSFPDCWRELHAVFDITTVSELPAFQLPAALAWVQAKIDGLSPSVPTVSPSVPNSPDFPLELAVYGYKGGKIPSNLWEEMQEAEKLLKNCANVVWLCCSSGCLSHMTSDKHLFYDMLKKSLSHAEASLTMAKQAVTMCLTLKSRVDFHSI